MSPIKLPILRLRDGIDFPELQNQVKLLQTKLGFLGDNIDGKFGSVTEAAVKRFQQDKGLVVDGIVGQSTWSAILDEPVEVFTPNLDSSHQLGIDVSNNDQETIDWQTVKRNQISFAFAKASQGNNFKDKTFADNWSRMKQANIIRGAYHFFQPSQDPEAQANNFLAMVKDRLESTDLPPVLDVENFPKSIEQEWKNITTVNQRIARIKQWLEKVEKETKRKPIIYTGVSFWQELMNDSQALTEYPLWIAHYTNRSQPQVPANNWGGKGWTLWQYTEEGKIAGVSGNVDINRFNGSLDELMTFVSRSIIG